MPARRQGSQGAQGRVGAGERRRVICYPFFNMRSRLLVLAACGLALWLAGRPAHAQETGGSMGGADFSSGSSGGGSDSGSSSGDSGSVSYGGGSSSSGGGGDGDARVAFYVVAGLIVFFLVLAPFAKEQAGL